jgi:prophage tail gpP-like protein
MIPVVITVGGAVLDTWTEMTLQRSKDELTGSLSVSIFAGALPSGPMVQMAKCGAEILVYVGGQLAFTGTVDKREGSGTTKGKKGADSTNKKAGKGGKAGGSKNASSSVTIGPNEYTIKLSARGQTKRLIDSSHQHPTTNMMQPTTKQVVEKLVEPWGTRVQWKGEVIKLDKMRLRDGAHVIDELHRIALENCYFMYETRDGQLCVTDGVAGAGGEPLILGQNILTFSAEQSEDKNKSKVKVKGQRTKKGVWGKKAVTEKPIKIVENPKVRNKAFQTIQHYGDATDKELERRARFEMNKRNSESQKITIEVFHVQSSSGKPWDIGDTHYVEVPPEGIFDMFECTELTYHVNAEKVLKTTLVLSPPPSGGVGGASGGFGLAALNMGIGLARRSQAGITLASNSYPDPWTPPMINELQPLTLAEEAAQPKPQEVAQTQPPPLTLPPWLGETA